MAEEKTTLTLISGADKGIGFATAQELGKRGQHVLIGARNQERGEKAVKQLKDGGIKADFIQLDVTDKAQIKAAAAKIKAEYGYLSILINNAGIAMDHHQPASELSTDTIRQDFDVNYFGLIDVTQAMVPLLKAGRPAKIINVSSNMGSMGLASDPNSRFYKVNSLGYQSSKASVNFATIIFSKELADEGITVNSVNPGWTATGFGGRPEDAPVPTGMQDVAIGAAQIIKMASLPMDDTTTGTFTENAGTLPW
ncbi:SDR family NAD(P)-dependent oxidoreductase [Lactobacillus sp. LC28-10]|uniref:SDR family NAD(P)-dependent oxidoreductase n=1 Tax=Secundilactobacillus angelensis TaxID=2722706 RepID=A0ABX1KTP8_9LACO|nr:SDR family NAD(P)-dependent oxidoreductase [Secundilactobacillus angelensis]MCH5461818.1 SDR family NAD(P)-dependent oxidoreductase [Secundilactobacillus angelensis]NLR17306.1 SDR family NAD(P)-dependent oxidoreductase [Secundilactobacillus angelensis]